MGKVQKKPVPPKAQAKVVPLKPAGKKRKVLEAPEAPQMSADESFEAAAKRAADRFVNLKLNFMECYLMAASCQNWAEDEQMPEVHSLARKSMKAYMSLGGEERHLTEFEEDEDEPDKAS